MSLYTRVTDRLPRGERLRQVTELLAAGPLTTREIADTLGIDPTLASVQLARFEELGHVAAGVEFTGQPTRGNAARKLWALGTTAPSPRGTWQPQPAWKRPLANRQSGPQSRHHPAVLAALAAGPMRATAVADAVDLLPRNASTMLRLLEKRGLVMVAGYEHGEGRGGFALLWQLAGLPPLPDPPPKLIAPPKPVREKAATPSKVAAAPKPRAVRVPKLAKVKPAKVQRAPADPKPAKAARGSGSQEAIQRVNDQAWAMAKDRATPVVAKTGAGETVEEFVARRGRIEVLPPTQYVPAPQQPVGWKT